MSLESAVKKTLNYARRYGCDLTAEEVGERLIGNQVYKLSDLRSQFKKRNENKYFENKMNKARWLAREHLSKFGNVLMVGVTGSVASKYPLRNDDIDLMIITSKDSLWIERLRLKIYLLKFGIKHRRFEEKHEKNKFCFNLWLDENGLEMPKNNRT